MFAMDWVTALITMLLTGCLYLYIFYRKPGLFSTFCYPCLYVHCNLSSPEANWGSSAQAQVFVNALKGVQVFGVDLAHRFLADLCLFVCSMLHWRSFDAYHNVHFVLLQSLTDTADHVKNYRPKLIVLTGNPATRCLHIFS